MGKIRLDLDAIDVETFSITGGDEPRGTVVGFHSHAFTNCEQTCNGDTACMGGTHIDDLCSANCTGIGVECYTADPVFYDCTGGAGCTDGGNCTYTTCTVNNVTCNYC